MKEVHFLARVLTHYRVPFHEKVRESLAAKGVNYRLFFSQGTPAEISKSDAQPPEWAEEVSINYLRGDLCYQHCLQSSWKADIVIIGQENKLLANYAFQTLRGLGLGPKVALFGHGKNFQSKQPYGKAEKFKQFWATKADWWFAYTTQVSAIVESYGFDPAKITVFNNTIDTEQISRDLAEIDKDKIEKLRQKLCGGSQNIAVYVGGLYSDKRLGFMLMAADVIKARLPDFNLIVVGNGESFSSLSTSAETRPWLHVLGSKFGKEKSELVSLAGAFLMPGLVGLAVVDTFAYGVPIITTAVKFHSPEIEYIENGVNGIILPDPNDVEGYADAVVQVLSNGETSSQLRAGAKTSLQKYSMDSMVERFVSGVLHAIDQPR